MSTIIGDNNDPLASFTLSPGDSLTVWWWGYGNGAYNIGFPFPPPIATLSNRVVVDSHGMESGDHGLEYSITLHGEASGYTAVAAVFRIEIGELP